MAELIDFNALKKAQAQKENDAEPGRGVSPMQEMLQKLDPENTLAILRIAPDRISLIREIDASFGGKRNSESMRFAQEAIRNWSKEDIIAFLNDSSPSSLKAKPALTVVAFRALFDFLEK